MDAKIIQLEPLRERSKKKKKLKEKAALVMAIREKLDVVLEQIVEIHKLLDDL